MVTGILNEPKAFSLFNWYVSVCTSSSVVALSRNGFNELFFRNFWNGLLESIMVFDKLEPKLLKTLLKALAISVGFVISLPFTLTMFRWTLLLDFSVKSCRIPFHIKVVLLRFLTINNLKYSFLYLRIEKVTLISQFFKFFVISFFFFEFQCCRHNVFGAIYLFST